MTDEIKYIDIAEFSRLGFLQEVNRLFFHPLGLALEVVGEADGSEHLSGIWDYRDDPEGIVFDNGMVDPEKVNRVDAERAKHAMARAKMFNGTIIQPVNPLPGTVKLCGAPDPDCEDGKWCEHRCDLPLGHDVPILVDLDGNGDGSMMDHADYQRGAAWSNEVPHVDEFDGPTTRAEASEWSR